MISKNDKLRKIIKELRLEREKTVFEKGLAAEENKDLRENFAYDYWFEREMVLTAKIRTLQVEIYKTVKVKTLKSKPNKIKEKPTEKIKDLPKQKWL